MDVNATARVHFKINQSPLAALNDIVQSTTNSCTLKATIEHHSRPCWAEAGPRPGKIADSWSSSSSSINVGDYCTWTMWSMWVFSWMSRYLAEAKCSGCSYVSHPVLLINHLQNHSTGAARPRPKKKPFHFSLFPYFNSVKNVSSLCSFKFWDLTQATRSDKYTITLIGHNFKVSPGTAIDTPIELSATGQFWRVNKLGS